MKKYILITGISFLMFSCGSSSPYSAPATSNAASGAPAGPTGPTSPNNGWNNFNFSANISGGSSASFQAVSIDKVNKTITVSLPLPFDATLAGIIMSAPLPNVSGATIAFGQLTDGTPVLTVTLPLGSIAKGVTGLPTTTLPDGSPLPGMPANSEPSTQVQVGKGKIPVYVYIGHMSIGLFVNTPFNPTIATHFGLTDNNANSVGAIYSIPYIAPAKTGGFFLNVNVPSQYTQLILNNL